MDDFLGELQDEVGQPLVWVIGEDFGKYGRFHLHILVANIIGGGAARSNRTAMRSLL